MFRQTKKIDMFTTFIRTITVITEPAVNGRLLRRHPHNGNLLAPRLHVKVATTQQGRDNGAAAEANLRQGDIFYILICIHRVARAKVDVGDAAVGLAPAQLNDVDGGVDKGKDGLELFPTKLRGETVDVQRFQRAVSLSEEP